MTIINPQQQVRGVHVHGVRPSGQQYVNSPVMGQTHHAVQHPPAQGQRISHELKHDPLAKLHGLRAPMKDALDNVFRSAERNLQFNAGVEVECINGKPPRLDQALEEYMVICDQAELNFKLVMEIGRYAQDSARFTPIPTMQPGRPAENHVQMQTYQDYLGTVQQQTFAASEIRRILREGLSGVGDVPRHHQPHHQQQSHALQHGHQVQQQLQQKQPQLTHQIGSSAAQSSAASTATQYHTTSANQPSTPQQPPTPQQQPLTPQTPHQQPLTPQPQGTPQGSSTVQQQSAANSAMYQQQQQQPQQQQLQQSQPPPFTSGYYSPHNQQTPPLYSGGMRPSYNQHLSNVQYGATSSVQQQQYQQFQQPHQQNVPQQQYMQGRMQSPQQNQQGYIQYQSNYH